jgi:hypothetical protein
MIHRFVNSGIELFIGNVLGLAGELVEGASQTFRTCAASFSRWSRMAVEGPNAHIFVIAQTAAGQLFDERFWPGPEDLAPS